MSNIPLGDRTAVRVDLYERRDSGYIDDVGTGNKAENGSDVEGGRISIRWPSRSMTLDDPLHPRSIRSAMSAARLRSISTRPR